MGTAEIDIGMLRIDVIRHARTVGAMRPGLVGRTSKAADRLLQQGAQGLRQPCR